MKIPEMTFNDAMRVLHLSEILFDEGSPLFVMRKNSDIVSWIITLDRESYQDTHTLEYLVKKGPVIDPQSKMADSAYKIWKRQNPGLCHPPMVLKELEPVCPLSAFHKGHVRWTRVRHSTTTFDKNGKSVPYEADVPVVFCSHPDCNTYYVDKMGEIILDVASKKARELSESKVVLKSS